MPHDSESNFQRGGASEGGRTATFLPQPPTGSGLPAIRELLRTPRNYEAGELHAQGGMGAIHEAHDRNIDRVVAMKVIRRDAQSQENTLRFIQEARVTGGLEHPNIVPVHEAGINERGEVFYTMKFVRGTTLRQVLDELRKGDPAAAARCPLPNLLTAFQKVCDAVAFAHAHGVIHRDLKPENIMLGDFGEVLLMDWGLAKVIGPSVPHRPNTLSPLSDASLIAPARSGFAESATMAGTVLGTPRYMAPEQARGEVDALDVRSDVFALGAVLFELLTLRHAIEGTSASEILSNAVAGRLAPVAADLRAPHAPAGRVPDSLLAVARKAMARNPAERYATVPELQAEITRYQNGFATRAEHAGFGKQLGLLVRRNKGVAITAAAAWLIITALAVWFVVNVTRERDRAEVSLTRLRATAPNFFDQAHVLTEARQFPEALAKIETALALDDTDAQFHAQRGNVLQSLGRHAEAAASYRAALALDPSVPHAADNLTLSEKLAKQGADAPGHEHLATLYDAFSRQQRTGEALALAPRLQLSAQTQLPVWREHIRRWTGRDDVLILGADGLLSITITNLPVPTLEPLRGLPVAALRVTGVKLTDLSPLAGLPLKYVSIQASEVADLSPLRGLAIEHLNLSGNTRIKDLSPIAGMPITYMNLLATSVTDLAPLRGMPLDALLISLAKQLRDIGPLAALPLDWLVLQDTGVSDLAPLRGSRIRRLSLFRSEHIRSVEPLLACPRLEEVCLPPNATNVAVLRGHPKLKIITTRLGSGVNLPPEDTAGKFWAEFDQKATRQREEDTLLANARQQIMAGGIPARAIAVLKAHEDGTLTAVIRDDMGITSADSLAGLPLRELHLLSTAVSNVSPLAGSHLLTCVLNRSPVADISPLSGCPIRDLSLQDTRVSSLEAVRSMPLGRINFIGTSISDVSPLLACTNLEIVCLSRAATNVHLLLTLPKLRYIGYRQGGPPLFLPETTAQEFWANFKSHGLADGLAAADVASANEVIRRALHERGVPATNAARIALTGDGTLDLTGLPIADIAFVRALPVRRLDLQGTRVSDLTPVRGLPLEALLLYDTPVADLSPLRECTKLRRLEIGKTQVDRLDDILHLELSVLFIGRTRIRDVAPLAGMTTLEEILLPEPAEHVAMLRALPRLRRISTIFDPNAGQVARSAAQFWAEFDTKTDR